MNETNGSLDCHTKRTSITPRITEVAHAGHLGGLVFGLLYWWSDVRLEFILGRKWHALRLRPVVPRRKPIPVPPPSDLGDQVDAILKKITEQGKDSLSEEERGILEQASARYRTSK